MPVFRRVKRESPDLLPAYRILRDGQEVADVVKTGRDGADDYPWDWAIADGIALGAGKRRAGASSTLTSAIDQIRWALTPDPHGQRIEDVRKADAEARRQEMEELS